MDPVLDTLTECSDETLLAQFATGDQAAARALTARHLSRVFNLARRMLSDTAEAEDITQEAMLKLWKIAPDWRSGEAKVSTWLYRITSNLCIDRLRKRRSVGLDKAPEPVDPSDSAELGMQKQDRARALHKAIQTLPERQRLALIMRHFDEMPNPEIAAVLETSVEAVESLLSRARRALTATLAPKAGSLGLSR